MIHYYRTLSLTMLNAEKKLWEKHLSSSGIQRTEHMPVRRHLMMVFKGEHPPHYSVIATSYTVVQKAKGLGEQVIFVNTHSSD